MLYIGFSNYSNKLHAKLFCNKYKHCAPIIINKDSAVIYQFVRINKIVKIPVRKKDLKILQKHGWQIIKFSKDIVPIQKNYYLTCVQFTKALCGIKSARLQTPLALFKYLTGK